MMFWAQVVLLGVAVIALAVVVETLLTDSALSAVSETLDFDFPRRSTSRPVVSSRLLGQGSGEPFGSAGDQSQK